MRYRILYPARRQSAPYPHAAGKPIILTVFARGTGDEGVTENDREEFRGVANIRDVDAKDCCRLLDDLIRGDQSAQIDGPMPSNEWICIAEGDSIEPGKLSQIMQNVRDGQLIRLEYADGEPKTGHYRYCMSHVIWFHGGGAPTGQLIRVLVEKA